MTKEAEVASGAEPPERAPGPVPSGLAVDEQVTDKPRHFASFDGLRAIAAVLVLLLHTAWVSGFTLRSSLGIYVGRLEIGVSIFFLISGFLLYRPFALSHLSGLPDPDRRRFWTRRLLRIVPAYWLALTVLTYVFHSVSLGSGWQGVVTHYLFLQIYFPTQVVNGIPQAWSLCTEMSFYLFLPLYAWVVSRGRRSPGQQLRIELWGLATLVVVSVAFRYWALHIPIAVREHGHLVPVCAPNCATDPPLSTLLASWLPSYLDLFALGMLLAVASAWFTEHRSEPAWLGRRWVPWASWGGALVAFWGVVPRGQRSGDHLHRDTPRQHGPPGTVWGLRLPPPAAGGVRSPGPVADSAPPAVLAHGQSRGHLLRHLSLAPQPDLRIPRLDRLAPGDDSVLAVGCGGAGHHRRRSSSASYFGLERPILRYKNRLVWWDRLSNRSGSRGTGAAPGS